MPWNWSGFELAEAASRGKLEHLQKLKITFIDTEAGQSQDALKLFLSNVNVLKHLDLTSYISPQTFDIVVERHSETLHVLSVYLSPERRPNLTHLAITVNKTRGDNNEVSIYQALGIFPRLEYLHLRLKYNVGPDRELWDDERHGEYPMANGLGSKIPFIYIHDAFTNAAVDATLAKAIFNLASAQGSLRHLKIVPVNNHEGYSVDQTFHGDFLSALRWFARPWQCARDAQGGTLIEELDRATTASRGDDWDPCFSCVLKEINWFEEELQGWFERVWGLRKSADWKNDGQSLPLDLVDEDQ
ncbi:hypothetical protein VTL71DRAFT_92 [Oculimacula yallundae]|uniref:Uncharacterized protein n=1 Tax=Oculimacula yallundae TaxID=86028 RepID=A0ABR4CZ87_9HELO